MPTQGTNLLTEQGTNGWENAFRQNGSELANFDTNTAGIAPQAPTQPNFTQPQQTQADFLRNFLNILGTPRFSHLDTAEALNRATPYLNAAEAQRVQEFQKALGLELGKAVNWDEYNKTLANGVIQKLANLDTLKTMIDYAGNRITQDRPQPFTVDYGGGIQQGVYDQVLGQFIPQNKIEKTLSPREVQKGDRWDKEFGFKQAQWSDQREDNKYAIDTQAGIERDKIEAGRNRQGTLFAGGNGKLYIQYPDGSLQKVVVDGEHIDAPEGMQGGANWTPGDGRYISANNRDRQ